MGWLTGYINGPCEHDYEPVPYSCGTDYDILCELQREGYPITVQRSVIEMNKSGEPIYSDFRFDLEMPASRYESTMDEIFCINIWLDINF